MDLLEIDGSVLEGGGQILRNALSLSCILRRPIKVCKIRAGRTKPGLAAQHLQGLNLLQQITNAKVSGGHIGSTAIEFIPGEIKSGNYFADTKTAGSISLLLQVALPVLLFGGKPSQLDLKGGTHAAMAPTIDFMRDVFKPNLAMFDATFEVEVFRKGFYPRGGGHCLCTIPPVKKLCAVENIEFGTLTRIFGWSFVSGKLPLEVADNMTRGAEDVLRRLGTVVIAAHGDSKEMSRDSNAGIFIAASTANGCVLGSTGLGDRRIPPQNTGVKAAEQLLTCLKNEQCTDQYVQDQLIIYMALADGTSKIQSGKLTQHTLTAIHIAELMTGVKFETKETSNGNCEIKCNGIGVVNQFL